MTLLEQEFVLLKDASAFASDILLAGLELELKLTYASTRDAVLSLDITELGLHGIERGEEPSCA